MLSKMAKTAQAANSSCARIALNQGVMYPQRQRSRAEQEQILSAYHERPSMRGIARTYHISRNTLKRCSKKGEYPTDGQSEFVASPSRRRTGTG